MTEYATSLEKVNKAINGGQYVMTNKKVTQIKREDNFRLIDSQDILMSNNIQGKVYYSQSKDVMDAKIKDFQKNNNKKGGFININ